MKQGKGRGDGKGSTLFPLVWQLLDQAGVRTGQLVLGQLLEERKERMSSKASEANVYIVHREPVNWEQRYKPLLFVCILH